MVVHKKAAHPAHKGKQVIPRKLYPIFSVAALIAAAWLILVTVVLMKVSDTHSQGIRKGKLELAGLPYRDKGADKEDSFFPHVYWINMENSPERRKVMESMFRSIASGKQGHNASSTGTMLPNTRVVAVDIAHVRAALDRHSVVFNQSTIRDGPRNSSANQYEFGEAACSLSHFKAIRQAYEEGHEMAIILEDDTALKMEFVARFSAHLAQVPLGWNILQLANCNPLLSRHLTKLEDPWVTWTPDFWSTEAYLINRRGMQLILDQLASHPSSETTIFVPEPGMVVADELLYTMATHAYSSTFPFVQATDSTSTLHAERRQEPLEISRHNAHPKWIYYVSQSILVFVTVSIHSISDFQTKIRQIELDSKTLCRYHPTCNWIVHMVTDDSDLFKLLQGSSGNNKKFNDEWQAKLLSTVEVYFDYHDDATTTNEKSNWSQFQYIGQHVHRFRQYDYVLLKDATPQLTGFPWLSFLDKKGSALCSGVLREYDHDMYLRDKYYHEKEWMGFQSMWDWRRAPWSIPLFRDVTPLRVETLELFFLLMEGEFAFWMFQQFVSPAFLHEHEEWEAETIICEAARDFLSMKERDEQQFEACRLVPLSISSRRTTNDQFSTQRIQQSVAGRQSRNGVMTPPFSTAFLRWQAASLGYEHILRGGNHWRVREQCQRTGFCPGLEPYL